MNSMRLPKVTYHEPKNVTEVLQIKGEPNEESAVLAGGTDLIPMLKRRNTSVRHLLNIKKVPEFRSISGEKGGFYIGPAVTLREILDHPGIRQSYPLLIAAAESVGFNQLRNMATLVGNICLDSKCTFFNQSAFWWKTRPDCFKRGGKICYVVKGAKRCYALSAADTVSALIAVEAEVIIQKLKEERRIPLEVLYTGDSVKPHALEKEEVVTGVILPPPSKGWLGGFLKESFRGSVDFPIASLSVRLKMHDDKLEDIRIVLNAVSTAPVRARKAEASLKRRPINEGRINEALELILQEASPISLIGATASYRRAVIGAMFVELMNSEIGREV